MFGMRASVGFCWALLLVLGAVSACSSDETPTHKVRRSKGDTQVADTLSVGDGGDDVLAGDADSSGDGMGLPDGAAGDTDSLGDAPSPGDGAQHGDAAPYGDGITHGDGLLSGDSFVPGDPLTGDSNLPYGDFASGDDNGPGDLNWGDPWGPGDPFAPGDTDFGDGGVVSAQLQNVREMAALAGSGTLAVNLPLAHAYVTYVAPAIGDEPAGFFLQERAAGPAVFVSVDVATLSPVPQVGDEVSLTVTEVAMADKLPKAMAVMNLDILSVDNDIASLVTNVTYASDLLTALSSYDSRMIALAATITEEFAAAGRDHVSARIVTPGIPAATTFFRLRLPTTLVEGLDLRTGCQVTLQGTPLWRYSDTAQPSAWRAQDLPATAASCAPPALLSVTPLGPTTVLLTFDRQIDPTSVIDPSTQFSLTPALTVLAADVAGRLVTLTTATQAPSQAYDLEVDVSVQDVLGVGISPTANSASFTGFATAPCLPAVVISQIYAGGGNTGAPYTNDFVELHNRSTLTVDLSSWSVQTTSAAGTSWTKTDLSGSMQPGAYYLIQMAAGGTPSGTLPTPDLTGMSAMGATAGKVALVYDQVQLSGACPTISVMDLVGYGATACHEGTAGTVAPSNTTSVQRLNSGCMDTNSNPSDFATIAPAPHNSASSTNTCLCQ